jgi:hypothetical protein
MDKEVLPFNFKLNKYRSGYVMEIFNDEETVEVDEIEIGHYGI